MPAPPLRFPDAPPLPAAVSTFGPTRAFVDLDAIAANIEALAQRAEGSALMAVIKANAYGHGSLKVAETALKHGASWLGVYAVQEGLVLREAGIQAPILVFGPFTPAQAPAIIEASLTPTVTTLEAAAALQQAEQGRRVKVHVKIDTGLSRAGVARGDALSFLRALGDLPALEPEGIFTHFASADERSKEFVLEQLQRFQETVEHLAAAGFTFAFKHCANSAAIIEVPESHLDLVRAGISLYGYYPSDEVSRTLPLRPALRLHSTVTRLHRIPAGTGVGYGHEFVASRDTAIALAPIGYGDGLSRRMGNGRGRVLIRGRSCPVVGRVSMDLITIDATDVPGATPGDDVVLIGRSGNLQQTAEDVARWEGSISYDVLTALLPRVPRVYLRQGEPVAVMSLPTAPRVAPLDRAAAE
jgi:alanine racemase